MTTEDEARLAEIRERCKSPPWQEHDIGFLLRLLDAARARIAQLDADYVQAAHDAGKMIDEREAKAKRLEDMAERQETKRFNLAGNLQARTAELVESQAEAEKWLGIAADWQNRAEAAELRLSQVENTIRVAIDREGNPSGMAALCELMFDLGFEPEPGR